MQKRNCKSNKKDVFIEKRNGNMIRSEVELCEDCSVKLKNLEDAFVPVLTELRINLYRNFMNFRG